MCTKVFLALVALFFFPPKYDLVYSSTESEEGYQALPSTHEDVAAAPPRGEAGSELEEYVCPEEKVRIPCHKFGCSGHIRRVLGSQVPLDCPKTQTYELAGSHIFAA